MRKRIIGIALSLCLGATVVGCSSNKGDDNNTTSSQSEESSGKSVNYSEGLDDNGYMSGVKASDYITLGTYKGMGYKKDDVAPSEDEIQDEIDYLLNKHATTNKITDGVIEDGTSVNIDYTGYIGEEAFDGGSTEGKGTTVTIGKTQYIDGFLEQLVGHKPGDEFSINVTFPEDYGKEELNGKEARFDIKINHIEETVVPEFNDAFVLENVEGYDNAEAYRSYLNDEMTTYNLKNDLWSELIENTTFNSYPEDMKKMMAEKEKSAFEEYLANYGMTLQSYYESQGTTEEEFNKQVEEAVEQSLQQNLVAQGIAEAEGFTVEEADLIKYVGEDYKDEYETYGQGYVYQFVLVQKAAQFLVDNAVAE